MPIPVSQFQISNPMGAFQQGLASYGQMQQNRYLPQLLQQQLLHQQLANQIQQPLAAGAQQQEQNLLQQQQNQIANQLSQNQIAAANAGVAVPTAQANLAYAQGRPALQAAQANAANAQGGYLGSEAGLNRFKLANPGIMLPGMAGQIAGIDLLQRTNPGVFNSGVVSSTAPQQTSTQFPYALPNPNTLNANNPASSGNSGIPTTNTGNLATSLNSGGLISTMMRGVTAPIQEKIAQANYYQSRAAGYNWSQMPQNYKNQQLGQAMGMGYDANTAQQLLMSGHTMADLANAKGIDPNNMPSPIYPMTSGALALAQKRNMAASEINTLNPILTNAVAPYAQRFAGYSPKQIADQISNDNPDAQAQFLAAKALQPEMAALRVKAMNGQVGIEAMREVMNASMGNIKSFQSLVNPKVYASAQQYTDQWINQAVNSANKAGASGSFNISSPIQTPITAQQSNMTRNINGKIYSKINGQWMQQ
jgi:hypothetical protein